MVELEARLARQGHLQQGARRGGRVVVVVVVTTTTTTATAYAYDVADADVPLVHVRRHQVLAEAAGREARRGGRELGLPGGVVRAAVCFGEGPPHQLPRM